MVPLNPSKRGLDLKRRNVTSLLRNCDVAEARPISGKIVSRLCRKKRSVNVEKPPCRPRTGTGIATDTFRDNNAAVRRRSQGPKGGEMGKAWRIVAMAGWGCLVASGTFGPAAAQVRYARPPVDEPLDFFSPYDESYGTSPSFQISPYGYNGPTVRVIERCQYPDGWNVTDFVRDVNGIPNGIDHTCRPSRVGGRARSRY